MKNIINKLKKYGLDYPRAIIWLVRLKRVDLNAKDEMFAEWIIRVHGMGDVEEKKYFLELLNIWRKRKVNRYERKLVERIEKFLV